MPRKVIKTLATIACLATGCAGVNKASIISSTALLACDWAQTRGQATEGWTHNKEENLIMGPAPTARTVDAYFAGIAVANVAAWLIIPARYRSVAPIGITAVQAYAVTTNAPRTGWCGVTKR